MNIKKFMKRSLQLITALIILIFILGILTTIFFLLKKENDRKAVFAGYAEGSIADYKLELYEDSTYYISCFSNKDKEHLTWTKSKDTIHLMKGNILCASFVKEELVSHLCTKMRCLELMRFKEFENPKIVDYPKHN